ncbi:MAG: hypothetical protein IPJ65_27815 [Archangiaceae bacterium]|nr:hypothetical protein [Archangiaceae bacterium]
MFARIALAQRWGLKELHTADPLMPVKRDAGWVNLSNKPVTDVATEMQTRYDLKQYVFPIEVRYAMRMMSPARFRTQSCH